MSDAHSARSFQHLYTKLACPCGMELRVKRDLAGTDVRCWSCRAMVAVPRSLSRKPVEFSALREAAADISSGRGMIAILAATVVTTAILSIPKVGMPLALALAIPGVWLYGELLRSGPDAVDDSKSEPETSAAGPSLFARYAFRLLATIVATLVVTAPWLRRWGRWEEPLRWTPPGLSCWLLGGMVVPLLLLAATAERGDRSLGWRRVAAILREHPVESAFALALIPHSVVLAEALVFAVSSYLGWLPLFLHDLFPRPESLFGRLGLTDAADNVTIRFPRPAMFRMYWIRLGQGYTLNGAIPGTLAVFKDRANSPWSLFQTPSEYHRMRAFIQVVALVPVLLGAALQARWLNFLGTTDARRPSRADD